MEVDMTVTVKSMGISAPEVRRGINLHEPIRQSMLTLDGSSLDGVALYAHSIVLSGSNGQGPGFRQLPTGADLAGTGNALKAYAVARGATIAEVGAAAIAPAIEFLRERLFIILNGSEHVEMPLVRNTNKFDASHDAGINLRCGYVGNLVLGGVAAADVDSIVIEGCVCVFVNDATGEITLGATGGSAAGVTEIPIKGTMVVSKGVVTANDGSQHVVIDYTC